MKPQLSSFFIRVILFTTIHILNHSVALSQHLVWGKQKRYGNPFPKTVLTDKSGSSYLLFGYGKMNQIVKYDSEGNWKWGVSIKNPYGPDPLYPSMAVDDSANLYIAGSFTDYIILNKTDTFFATPGNWLNSYIAKIDSSGSIIFKKQLHAPSWGVKISAIVTDDKCNFIIGGVFGGSVDFDMNGGINILNCDTSLGFNVNKFISKYDCNGNLIWAKQLNVGTPALNYSYFPSPVADHSGNFYWLDTWPGDYDPGPGTFMYNDTIGCILARYDSAGNFIWAKKLAIDAPVYATGGQWLYLSVDSLNNPVICGSFQNAFDIDPGPGMYILIPNNAILIANFKVHNLFVVKYDTSGAFLWAKGFWQTGLPVPLDLKTDSKGNIFISGVVAGIVDFCPDSGICLMGSQPKVTAFIFSLDSSGEFRFGFSPYDVYQTNFLKISIDYHDNLFASGDFNGSIDIDPDTGVYVLEVDTTMQNNYTDVFLAKYSFDNTYNICKGKVLADYNQNGIIDSADIPRKNVKVYCPQNISNYVTDAYGNYSAVLEDTGSYDLQVNNFPPYFSQAIPSNYNFQFSTFQNVDTGINFLLQPISNITDVQMTLVNYITVMRHGSNHYRLLVKNKGTAITSGSIVLKYDSNLIYTSSSIPFISNQNDSLIWNYPNLNPEQTYMIDVTFFLPFSVPSYLTHMYATALPLMTDTMPADNIDSIKQLIVFAYDPNEKYTSSENGISSAEVADSIYLDYQVSFQNVGNDTAFSVIVIDTLSDKLNVGSFELITTSHPCKLLFDNGNIAKFRFDNINLPDSNVNEVASHGFIKYRIRAKSNLSLGNIILNNASIYFNAESPVITNTVATPVINIITDINSLLESADVCVITPNPNNGTFTITLTSSITKDFLLCIINPLGQTIFNEQGAIGNKQNVIDVNMEGAAKGLYLVEVVNGGKVYRGKVMVR